VLIELTFLLGAKTYVTTLPSPPSTMLLILD
jgi:hypothetical protein